MTKLDNRIVSLTITFQDGTYEYTNMNIEASGSIYASAINGSAIITINNIYADLRERILSASLPEGDPTKKPIVELKVGRESYGSSTLFTGIVFTAKQTAIPNLGITLNCLTGFDLKYKTVDHSSTGIMTLNDIASLVASDNKLILAFNTTNKNVKNFKYHGSANDEIAYLEKLFPDLRVYSDGKHLNIIDKDKKQPNQEVVDVSAETGLLRITPITSGVKLDVLYDQSIKLQSVLKVKSYTNPALNGNYIVFMTDFSITSRSDDFMLSVSARRI